MRPKGSAEVLSDRRRRALQLVDQGVSLNAVARKLGCSASSVMRWRDQRSRGGDGVYEVHASAGRPSAVSAVISTVATVNSTFSPSRIG